MIFYIILCIYHKLDPIPTEPCTPSPCGPNSICRAINNHAVCSCVLGYIGSPPTCRPECIRSSDCNKNEVCTNQKCMDPCPGTCGVQSLCQVINHSPICTCPAGYTGDPFIRCSPSKMIRINCITKLKKLTRITFSFLIVPPDDPVKDPCQPSPCGLNSICQVINDQPSCSCQSDFIGSPPNCRAECLSNSDCSLNLACKNRKCINPCPGLCGANAECHVISHTPMCSCLQTYTGDPFTQCYPTRKPIYEY